MALLRALTADKSVFSACAGFLAIVDGITVLAVGVSITLLNSEEGWSIDDTEDRAAGAGYVSLDPETSVLPRISHAVAAIVDLAHWQQLLSTSSNTPKHDQEIGALSAFQVDALRTDEKATRSRHSYFESFQRSGYWRIQLARSAADAFKCLPGSPTLYDCSLITQRLVESARWPIYGQIDSITNEHFSKREKLDETHPRSGAWAQDRHTTVASEAKITSLPDQLGSFGCL
ncbi:uncharacterized protein M437DRAFT_68324 [Aureobasidium melanogenum CBS 110374]|uniref:Uncharacterized protein n=1 Tax=Aureobasidium melanogenum (strain CBS 110374) TaxID=1043003 RepID=A0A074VRS9_AURM1|nr:uncharacterized protein M437DRAFT_68324 [Aureobasidium melanogenum CBS 110374]KEQ60422.1 hypothetical protein M437DRAFT_68324 [Aureobasidium melanogenum CBS 110374]